MAALALHAERSMAAISKVWSRTGWVTHFFVGGVDCLLHPHFNKSAAIRWAEFVKGPKRGCCAYFACS